MGEKQDLIKQLDEMQKKFIAIEQKEGVSMEDYFIADEGHPLYNFRQKYTELSNKLVDMAHKEKGSHR